MHTPLCLVEGRGKGRVRLLSLASPSGCWTEGHGSRCASRYGGAGGEGWSCAPNKAKVRLVPARWAAYFSLPLLSCTSIPISSFSPSEASRSPSRQKEIVSKRKPPIELLECTCSLCVGVPAFLPRPGPMSPTHRPTNRHLGLAQPEPRWMRMYVRCPFRWRCVGRQQGETDDVPQVRPAQGFDRIQSRFLPPCTLHLRQLMCDERYIGAWVVVRCTVSCT